MWEMNGRESRRWRENKGKKEEEICWVLNISVVCVIFLCLDCFSRFLFSSQERRKKKTRHIDRWFGLVGESCVANTDMSVTRCCL